MPHTPKIFIFSDMDDTLIQTTRKTNFDKDTTVFVVDNEGQPISHIYRSVEKLLRLGMQNPDIVIIPTTARSLESYRRTAFYTDPSYAAHIEYAILNFGGVILNNGVVDRDWQEFIITKYNNLSTKIEIMYDNIILLMSKKFSMEHGLKIRLIDGLYVDVLNKKDKLDTAYNHTIEQILREYLKESEEYYLYVNGPSFALLPRFLNKSLAVKHLLEKYKPLLSIGAGDNTNDLDFMFETDFLIVPNRSHNAQRLKA
ncbi:MAG: hypothetical protein KU38_08325 [Sulfurovum sp. FS08-3]|nr:MAG: hypothetical protein KU38_08325 [Sulfurovum sp. FS08-3]